MHTCKLNSLLTRILAGIIIVAFTCLSVRTAEFPAEGVAAPEQNEWAYVFYATDEVYFCNAIINASRLRRLGVTPRADIAIFVPQEWRFTQDASINSLKAVAMRTRIKLLYIPVVSFSNGFWRDSFTKLRIFQPNATTQYAYRKVVYMDADSLVNKPLDGLFSLPEGFKVAAPRAYWLKGLPITSALLVVEPSEELWGDITAALARPVRDFDGEMELLNDLYRGYALVLPNQYILLSGSILDDDHTSWLAGSSSLLVRTWDPEEVRRDTFVFHFSEGGPKPWHTESDESRYDRCGRPGRRDSEESCKASAALWHSIMDEYRAEKRKICRM